MDIVSLLILGLVQGLTEFLPISSSGHLVFIQELTRMEGADLWVDTALHIGSVLAILVFFRQQLGQLFQGLLKAVRYKSLAEVPREFGLVLVASLPAAFIGLTAHDFIETLFGNPRLLPFTFLITAIILYSTKTKKIVKTKTVKKISLIDAFFIGLFQALAILPGVSRSGSTYSAARWRQIKRFDSFYFSFLMSIPAIIGAFILESWQQSGFSIFSIDFLLPLTISFLSSFAALAIFRYLLKFQKIYYFSFYCVLMAVVSWIVFY